MILALSTHSLDKKVKIVLEYKDNICEYVVDLKKLPDSLEKLNDSMSVIDAELVLMFLATTCRNLNLHSDAITLLMLRKVWLEMWCNDGLHDN